ncbi:RHOMBOID-like protein 10, chloroplastic isoform X2 [Punica granatum]|uniref:RHOMBOID-like protein 10, chloroplastic isoform X2 n=1 Tax=Punica granatum TaxID=22663 RepID=A0A6P8CEK4_PUNGR|nr:RHOMBOID-like protein 10, chloroplastic isoform X2 [Punica granatum]
MIGMGSAASSIPPHHQFLGFGVREVGAGGAFAVHALNTASSLRLCLHLRSLVLSSFKARLKDVWGEKALNFNGVDFLQSSRDAITRTCLSFFNYSDGREGKFKDTSVSRSSTRNSSNRRLWTNVILVLNVLWVLLLSTEKIYAGQLATQGKMMFWGAKINSLIDKGQIWRLVTSSFLHANAVHLMINCYSLNSVGPSVETISGPRRFLTVYFTSAIASSAMSYWFSRGPAVGASGAIFGLVGSLAMFTLRHRRLIVGAEEDLKRISNVIILNMVIGLLSRDIDNWGHLGGLLGGVVASWLIGPAWKYNSMSKDGQRIFTDRAPIFFIIKGNKEQR